MTEPLPGPPLVITKPSPSPPWQLPSPLWPIPSHYQALPGHYQAIINDLRAHVRAGTSLRLTYSLPYLLARLLTYLLAYLLTCLFTYLTTCLLTYVLIGDLLGLLVLVAAATAGLMDGLAGL